MTPSSSMHHDDSDLSTVLKLQSIGADVAEKLQSFDALWSGHIHIHLYNSEQK
jgi:hypothetical protein